jgi:dipeptidyl-peptidase 4
VISWGMPVDESFPLLYSRTQHFTLGNPRSFRVAPDGSRAVFLRSTSGEDARLHLWSLDVGEQGCAEREVVDPSVVLAESVENLSSEERARRERSRESAAGIVAYATDRAVRTAAFALSGRLFAVDLTTGETTEIATPTPVIDPRLSPDGSLIAYVCSGELRVVRSDGSDDRCLVAPDGDGVMWGLADFIAAEELGRGRGHWWSPAGDRLLVARVDDSPVAQWWISDPSDPSAEPRSVRYPAAGTANADVRLSLIDLDGRAVAVEWDRDALPYVVDVGWDEGNPLLVYVMSRDQATAAALAVDIGTGATSTVLKQHDDAWVERIDGAPRWTPDGRLVHVEDAADVRRLMVAGVAVTGAELHIRAVRKVDDDAVVFVAASGTLATEAEIGETHVYRVAIDGSGESPQRLSGEPGVHTAACGGGLTVLSSSTLEVSAQVTQVLRAGSPIGEVVSRAVEAGISPRFDLVAAGERQVPTVVQLPTGYSDGDGLLPVLVASYAGPVIPTVLCSRRANLYTQWFADQGFAVLVIDGRGTPGHSVSWEKAVRHDFAGPVLEDQIDALHAVARTYPLDLDRVAIGGWSFGGYLAGLAALRRPDVFHAAVVGAPVTDWRLYDTAYTERYLGTPDENREVYAANSLITDEGLSRAAELARPMLIIHGLADDNVTVANTLRLSSALLAAGRSHEVLPLTGVTHMTSSESLEAKLMRHQIEFLTRALGSLEPRPA